MASVSEAVKEFAKSEIGNVQEAGREMVSHPQDIGSKFIEFLKGLWERFNAAGLVDMIVAKVKDIFSSFSSNSTPAPTSEETLPLVQNSKDGVAGASA